MKLNAPKNPNYCATVVALNQFVNLAGCDNVKAAIIFGNHVIVGKDTNAGDVGLFFPVETQLMREFLANNNLYRKPEWGNLDPEKKGFFEQHGRVKCMKFRGHKSEGFWIPLNSVKYLNIDAEDLLGIGDSFDELNDHPICKKYIPRQKSVVGNGKRQQTKHKKVEDKIVPGQFQFHVDTENLRRNIHKIQPDHWISISDKWHGTSAIFANVLVQRELRWWERLLRWAGVRIQDKEYGLTWSSRRVVKGVNGECKETARHFYTEDIWGVVAKELEGKIPKGYTIYGEIVGYTKDGAQIQKGYHYGCQPGTHRFLVYRVTITNEDGKVVELSWQQMKDFCAKYGLEMVQEFFYGWAESLLLRSAGLTTEDWQSLLLRKLEEVYVHDELCPHNNFEVPAEGIVLRVECLDECLTYKLKNFAFTARESQLLDKEELDIETAESLEEV